MRTAFRSEALELLEELDTALLALETEPQSADYVHRVFRAIHTIKGSGATAGFSHLAAVAHDVEEAFDLARSGRLAVSSRLIDCGLRTSDLLRTILSADDSESECAGEQELGRAISDLLRGHDAADGSSPATPATVAGPVSLAGYEVVVRPHRDLFYSGIDPMTLLDELRGLGQAHVTARVEDVPLLLDLEPESCYLWWEIRLVTDRGEDAIRDVFTFVEGDCEVSIRLLDDQTSAVAMAGVPAESLELYLVECQEHLHTVEAEALALEAGSSARESLDALFRAVHNVKGNTGLLLGQLPAISLAGDHPLATLARMAHGFESLLDSYRQDGAKPASADTVAVVLEARDAMQGLLDSVAGVTSRFIVPAHLLQQLCPGATTSSSPPSAAVSAFQSTAAQCLELLETCLAQLEDGRAGRPTLKAYQRGLKTLASAAAYQNRPDLDEPLAVQLKILDVAMKTGQALTLEDHRQLQSSLVATRARIFSDAKPDPKALPKQRTAPEKVSATGSATIRIDQEKLDRLMRVVGELLVAKGSFPTLVERLSAGEDPATITRMVKDTGASISHIAEELQASVMAIRMLPVKTVLQRFPRQVRDLARSLGKEVQLVVEGDAIELDKTILEQIGDPLVHLVRNAVDHGLEPPDERRLKGKPPCGRLTLRARSEGGNVWIEVEDDGRGLDSAALKRKALQKGLITAEAASHMSHGDACRLVFLPGLSTAEAVTEVSGRGVGMDVVRNNIRELQGTVEISSTPGRGSTFSIKLPTSLIVSKGILLEAGGQEYILPLVSIRDMVKLPSSAIHDYAGQRMTQVRGQVYTLFSLAELFDLPPRCSEELSIAVIESGKVRYGLIADRFVSEVEVLVKPLAAGLQHCREFHGAAILGDGRVVLVLNPLECHRLEAVGSR